MPPQQNKGWVGFDLDNTLAFYDRSVRARGKTAIGRPIEPVVAVAKRLLAEGVDVRIFTARASEQDPQVIGAIHAWCRNVFGRVLPVTNCKDHLMIRYYDDKAVSVEKNTGRMVDANGGEVA